MATRPARGGALTGYVLHRYDWSESSLVLDVFTREEGRLAVAAKGAKRPYSQLRAVLLPFQRVQLALSRPSDGGESREVHALRGAEWSGGAAMLTGAALFSGFYLNELLLRLLARHDPHPALFDAYAHTLPRLAGGGETATQAALRAFELVLLKEIGLLPDLGVETPSQRDVETDRHYRLLADAGVVASELAADATLPGAVLPRLASALAANDLDALQRLVAPHVAPLRTILRAQLHYHLGTASLRTRQVMIDAQALER